MPEESAPMLRPEHELILLLTHPRQSPELLSRIHELVSLESHPLDWREILDQSARHRLLPLVARRTRTLGVTTPYPWLFDAAYLATRQRNLLLMDELADVLHHLHANQVDVILRKGLILALDSYHDLGVRRMSDIDFLIHPESANAIKDALLSFGYAQSEVSTDGRSLTPFDRQTNLMWKLNVDNLLPFSRSAGTILLPAYSIDVCRGLSQPRSGFAIPTTDLFERSRPFQVGDSHTRSLSESDFLMDLCMHLNKEATALYYINIGEDHVLSRFTDIATFISQRTIDRESFLGIVRTYGIAEPVYYSLHFTEIVYPQTVPKDWLDALRPESLQYLDEYGSMDGERFRWLDPFLVRLFDIDRATKAQGTSVLVASSGPQQGRGSDSHPPIVPSGAAP